MLEGLHVNISALITPPNLHFASPRAKEAKARNKIQLTTSSFVGYTIAFTVCNKALNP